MEGFLLIDKPAGLTSHDVVNRIRRFTGEKRVGHAGTLDPFATGLLIVGVGRVATREMQKLVGLDKVYEAEFVLGASSDTDDRTGVITQAPTKSLPLAKGELEWVLSNFIGEISQIPPTYSAIKIGGKKMYEEARKGKPLVGKPRRVNVYSIQTHPDLHLARGGEFKLALTIHCSSGTYIRSLARDLGAALGGGGYVEQLRRTAIGPFSIQEASTLAALEALAALDALPTALPLIPVSDLLSRLLTSTHLSANLTVA